MVERIYPHLELYKFSMGTNNKLDHALRNHTVLFCFLDVARNILNSVDNASLIPFFRIPFLSYAYFIFW